MKNYDKNQKKKFQGGMAAVLAAVLLLAGCGSGKIQELETVDSVVSSSGEVIPEGIFPGEAVQDIFCEAQEYELPDWKAAMREMGIAGYLYADYLGLYRDGVFQTVVCYNHEGRSEISKIYIQVFSYKTGKWTAFFYDGSEENREAEEYSVSHVFAGADGRLYCCVGGKENERRMALLGPEGVEELPGDWEELLIRCEEKEGKLAADASGNFYVYDNPDAGGAPGTEITAYDSTGKKQWDRQVQERIFGLAQADGESLVYWYGLDGEGRVVVREPEAGQSLIEGLKDMSGGEFRGEYTDTGLLCLTDSDRLWALGETGVQKVFDFVGQGYRLEELYALAKGEEDTLRMLVRLDGNTEVLTVSFSKEKPKEKQEITLALTMRNVFLENVIAAFNRQSADYHVSVVLPENSDKNYLETDAFKDRDDLRQKIQLELSSGEGPDILGDDVLTDRDSCAQNGYLEKLDIKEFPVEDCYEGAFAGGMISGELYGVPLDFTIDYAAYRKQDVDGTKQLTTEELMERVRASGAKILQRNMNGEDIVIKYALSDSSNREYIDWENGESHLTEQPFLELLTFAAEYADANKNIAIEDEEVFAVGDDHGIDMGKIYHIKNIYNSLGGDVCIPGYPRKEGYGIYLKGQIFYVNRNSERKEGALEFLKYMVSAPAQKKYVLYDADRDSVGGFLNSEMANFPVNKSAMDVLFEREREEDLKNTSYVGEDGERVWVGEPYTEEQLETVRFMLENARPPEYGIAALKNMVMEELEPYFEGSITAEQAAEILNNRVQLYLDENLR